MEPEADRIVTVHSFTMIHGALKQTDCFDREEKTKVAEIKKLKVVIFRELASDKRDRL